MAEQLVPAVLTPATTSDMVGGFTAAWRALFGVEPERKQLAIVWAQWAHETGRGKFCRNWNLGNAKHVPGDGREFCQFRCSEILNGKEVWFDPPSPYTSFVSFPTLAFGCMFYLRLISNGRYKKSWQNVLDGDPVAFVHAIKIAGYFTASESLYSKSIVSLWNEFMRAPAPPPELHEITDDDRAKIMALVDRTIAETLIDIGGVHALINDDTADTIPPPADDEPEPAA